MFINFQEFFNVIPIIIIAAGIVFSLLIEMYSKKSEVFLPWFSVLMFLAAGLHSLIFAFIVRISVLFESKPVELPYAIKPWKERFSCACSK